MLLRIYSGLLSFTIQVVFLYCFPNCPSCRAHLSSIGWAAWAIWAAIKKYSLSLKQCVSFVEVSVGCLFFVWDILPSRWTIYILFLLYVVDLIWFIVHIGMLPICRIKENVIRSENLLVVIAPTGLQYMYRSNSDVTCMCFNKLCGSDVFWNHANGRALNKGAFVHKSQKNHFLHFWYSFVP